MEGRKKIKVGEIRESVFQLSLDKKRLDIIKSANFTHRLNSASRKAKTTKFEIVAPLRKNANLSRRRILYFPP